MTCNVCPVTVVIPFFNGHDTIRRAVTSVMLQRVRPSEVIIVDDGSLEPLRRDQIDLSGNIKVIRHPVNRGIPSARNTGILAASHDWIAFLDQDDEYMPDKLARQWVAVVRSGYDDNTIFWGRLLLETPEGSRVHPSLDSIVNVDGSAMSAVRELVLRGMVVPFITLLVNRHLLVRYGLLDPEIRGGADDYEFVLRMAALGVRFVNTDVSEGPNAFSAVHHYTGRNYSNAFRILKDEREIMQQLSRRFPFIKGLIRRRLARVEFALGRYCHRSGQIKQAVVHYKQALKAWPFFWRPWAALFLARLPANAQDLAMRGFEAWKAATDRRLRGRQLI